MKAEHRKELETNVLADRMGRMLEGVKQKPKGGTVLLVVVGIIVAAVVFYVVRSYQVRSVEGSEAWFDYFLGNDKAILETHSDRMQGKAVRFDRAWEGLWTGVKQYGVNAVRAKELLQAVAASYEKLIEECEDDPVLIPEALFGLAVIKETLAIDDRANLDAALDRYKELADKHGNSAYGQLAKERVETLSEDGRRREIADIYQDLERIFGPERRK